MRRIVAITLIVIIAFLVAYGLFDPFTDVVNGFALNVLGPAGFAAISSLYLTIVASIGIPGLWATGIIIGVVFGLLIYKYWHKTDWWLRRWGQARTARDMGTTTVTHLPSTPVSATIRPTQVVTTPEPTPKLEPAVEEVKVNE